VRVALEKVHKSFGAVEVVKGLDLEAADGELLVLLGPSGCGKTTALRMIAGLEPVTAGRIRIGERDVTDELPKYRDVAMVFQSYALYPHMTVAENIGYPLKLRKTPRDTLEQAVRAAAARVHLLDFLDRRPRQLSGGQRQRVALARAMVRRPAVFLMDEPLSNLDAQLRGHMRSELKHLQRSLGITTIYVTHDQIEAMTLAHRVAVMHQGSVQQIGAPAEIYDDPVNLFVAGFIGSPPMNRLDGRIAGGSFVTPGCTLPAPGFADHAEAVLGFRPEDCRIVDPGGGALSASVFAVEMTGNETIVTCTIAGSQVVARMDKGYDAAIDAPVGIAVEADKTCLFDGASGARVRAATA